MVWVGKIEIVLDFLCINKIKNSLTKKNGYIYRQIGGCVFFIPWTTWKVGTCILIYNPSSRTNCAIFNGIRQSLPRIIITTVGVNAR